MPRSPASVAPAALALALALVLLGGATARAADRAPCTLHGASGDIVSDLPDGTRVVLTPAKPLGLANWDVRWWQRHRLWVAMTVENTGDRPANVVADIAVDRAPDGSVTSGQLAAPLVVPAHARVSQRLTAYLPDDAKTAGVRLVAQDADAAVNVTAGFALDCSERRFDVGEVARTASPLLEEAMKTYFAEFVDPLASPAEAFETVKLQASGAQDAFDVAWAMRYLMATVHDEHSFIRPPAEPDPVRAPSPARPPALDLRADGTAVLRLPGFSTASVDEARAYAARLHELVAAAQARRPRAWIVDLRQDDGTDEWAALAALGPLLGGPIVGAFETRDGRQPWFTERGTVRLAGGPAIIDLQLPPGPPFAGPIAVLVGPGTADAGETVAIAFAGRPRTRFFGAPTHGAIDSALRLHTLADGTRLGVVVARDVDRTGTIYRGPLEPDVKTTAPLDELPAAAVEWVREDHP